YEAENDGYFFDRRGDYSGAGIDPSDPGTVWVAGEYARVEGGAKWGTWIAQLRATQANCDVNHDGAVHVTDVQLVVDQALGIFPATSDINGDGVVNVVDVQ